MAIHYDSYTETSEVECDYCSYCEEFDGTFREIVESMKNEGWIMLKDDGEWMHKCPSCVEEENGIK